MKELTPSLEKVQKELKGLFAAAGVLMNECFCKGSGNSLLGLAEGDLQWGAMALEKVDLEKTNIGRYLPIYFAYAYEGRAIPGYENELDDSGDNSLERLRDFIQIFHPDSSYFDLCLDVAGIDVEEDVGYLEHMIERISARQDMDEGKSLSIFDIAILAGMNERSVKNAVSAEGEGRLIINANGQVDNDIARKWLSNRRGFQPTQKKEFPVDLQKLPDDLDGFEIPAFIKDRITRIYSENMFERVVVDMAASPETDGGYIEYPPILKRAAKKAGISPSVIQAAMQQPLRIKPEHCVPLAKAIGADPVWFTMQVMRALFPTEVDMLLNPQNYDQSTNTISFEGNSVDVILTEAMIKHGYLDIPSYAKGMFPSDCFGGRAGNDKGSSITLKYGDMEVETDVRVKSENTISPRKRFTSWFEKGIAAKGGDRIRVTRLEDRVFEMTHLTK